MKVRAYVDGHGSFLDYPSYEDMSVSVYFCGCEHNCDGCHNGYLKDVHYAAIDEISIDELIEAISIMCNRLRTNKVVLLGGDPLHPHNRYFVKELIDKSYKQFSYCIYTGYNIDIVKNYGIGGFDFIKCGTFMKEFFQSPMKDDYKMVLASTNQVIYNKNLEQISHNGILYFRRNNEHRH